MLAWEVELTAATGKELWTGAEGAKPARVLKLLRGFTVTSLHAVGSAKTW